MRQRFGSTVTCVFRNFTSGRSSKLNTTINLKYQFGLCLEFTFMFIMINRARIKRSNEIYPLGKITPFHFCVTFFPKYLFLLYCLFLRYQILISGIPDLKLRYCGNKLLRCFNLISYIMGAVLKNTNIFMNILYFPRDFCCTKGSLFPALHCIQNLCKLNLGIN